MKDLSDMEIRLATEADLPTIDEPVPLGGCGVVLPGRDYSGCEAERSGLRRTDAADHDVVRKAGERLALVSYASTRVDAKRNGQVRIDRQGAERGGHRHDHRRGRRRNCGRHLVHDPALFSCPPDQNETFAERTPGV